ncbi:hypothetical protein [Streptomyces sp. A5-4]|uniref:hypothetical protein n=1 Tax=Streptomyces sp. A5-4 TaxID=3384771 RepID=UPI003DA95362
MSGIPTAPAPVPAPRGRRRAPGRTAPHPAPYGPPSADAGSGGSPGGDAAGDVVRWAAFSCALVPVVLVAYGTSLGGAASAALGLVAVTMVCRVLLRQSERAAAGVRAGAVAEQTGQTRQIDRPDWAGPGEPCPGGPDRTAPGAHRSGRHAGGSAPGE